jgi:hypothetical protein
MDISLDHLDSPTRKAALEILMQDAKDAITRNSERKDQLAHDSTVALHTYLTDLEQETTVESDRIMAQSIGQAVRRDESIIADATAQEDQAESDRRAALQLHETGRLPAPAEPTQRGQNYSIDDERRNQLEAEYNMRPRDNGADGHGPRRRPAEFRTCTFCLEKVQTLELVRLPCAHEYCRGCVKDLFTQCLKDESLYPPRCCTQTIPDTDARVQTFLGGELLSKFLARRLELETPNRTYCHIPDCSAFIPPKGIKGDIGACPKCQAKTCSICKAPAHIGTDCPQDETAQQLLDIAKKEGWKQCRSCNRVIELSYGCNHICKPTSPR